MNKKRLKTIMTDIVKGLCEYPTSVSVDLHEVDEGRYQTIIYVHPDDIKLVIGRGGKNIQSLRTLIYAMSAKFKIRCYISIEENLMN